MAGGTIKKTVSDRVADRNDGFTTRKRFRGIVNVVSHRFCREASRMPAVPTNVRFLRVVFRVHAKKNI